jgi:hypothetical protein
MSDEELESSFEGFGAPILPIQYWASIKGRKDQEGERGLLLAVLEDAIRCYVANMNAHTRRGQLIFAEARNWFYPRDESKRAPISFESICDLLGIETEALRRRLNFINAADLTMNHRPVRRSRVREPHMARGRRTAKFGAPVGSASMDAGPDRVAGAVRARPPSCGAERPRARCARVVGSMATQLARERTPRAGHFLETGP